MNQRMTKAEVEWVGRRVLQGRNARLLGGLLLVFGLLIGLKVDMLAPTVSRVSPEPMAGGVPLDAEVRVTFNEDMFGPSLEEVVLLDESGGEVPATVKYARSNGTLHLNPARLLSAASSYRVVVPGGLSGVMDVAGNRMRNDYEWKFSTIGYGASVGGPGGPILVIADRSNHFGRYYAEILLAEGFNAFAMVEKSDLNEALLSGSQIAILGEGALTNSEVAVLEKWVQAGGALIAMRPDQRLSELLGIKFVGTGLADGYLKVSGESDLARGIVEDTMQFHGMADRWGLAGAQAVADLYLDATTASQHPAVVFRPVGTKGGCVAAFSYDLAKSVVQTRQGNPAWVGQDRDGIKPMRSNDLFFGAARFDPQPDWVNLNKVDIPQADEQMRLLTNLMLHMSAHRIPLPRFWYFPKGGKAVVVMTGDDHGHGGTGPRFESYLRMEPFKERAGDWDVIRGTSYVFPSRFLTNAEAVRFESEGFEIGLHLDTGGADYNQNSLDRFFSQQLKKFRETYPGVPSPTTHRVHCIAWSGYTTLPEVELRYGIRLNTSYYYWPSNWVQGRAGFFTGSGLPMRFASENGRVIDVYQAATQATDESGQLYPDTVAALLDRALGPEGYYGAFVVNMHTDEAESAGSDAIIRAARGRGVPVIAAKELLRWVDERNRSSFQKLSWAPQESGSGWELTFELVASPEMERLVAMVPVFEEKQPREIRFEGRALEFSMQTIKGISYAMFAGRSGTYRLSFSK